MRNVMYFTDNELMAMKECLSEWPDTLDMHDFQHNEDDDKKAFFDACNSAMKKARKELAHREELDLIKKGVRP